MEFLEILVRTFCVALILISFFAALQHRFFTAALLSVAAFFLLSAFLNAYDDDKLMRMLTEVAWLIGMVALGLFSGSHLRLNALNALATAKKRPLGAFLRLKKTDQTQAPSP